MAPIILQKCRDLSKLKMPLLMVLWGLVGAVPSFALFNNDEIKDCQPKIEGVLLNQALKATTTFPASQIGISIDLNGSWDTKYNQKVIKATGVGIAIGETATVTQVKLKADLLEIHLNGGGFGTFADRMTTSTAERIARRGASKASGGSRINLEFGKASLSCAQLTDADQLIAILAPLVDAGSLKLVAARQQISSEWADAAAKKLIVIGMDKLTVFAIFGDPKQKTVDLSSEPPTEKWQYELSNLKTRVATFKDGKVVKIDEF